MITRTAGKINGLLLLLFIYFLLSLILLFFYGKRFCTDVAAATATVRVHVQVVFPVTADRGDDNHQTALPSLSRPSPAAIVWPENGREGGGRPVQYNGN